jgi:hypothetical protein
MKNKVFKEICSGIYYRITNSFADIIWAKPLKSHNMRAKMGEHHVKFSLPELQNENNFQFIKSN